ncbi:MAG: YdcF family protein [Clostridiales bacterium]|nr:YdcF family protein [Clostridiales bacterium]
MKKYWLIFLSIFMVVFCYAYVRFFGNEYVYHYHMYFKSIDVSELSVAPEAGSEDHIEVLDYHVKDNTLYVKVRGLEPGKGYVEYKTGEETGGLFVFYVHGNGVVTFEDYFGDFTGSFLVRTCVLIYLALLIFHLIRKYKKLVHENMYQYKCILLVGLITFFGGEFLLLLLRMINMPATGLVGLLGDFMDSLKNFALLTFPVIVIVSIFIVCSNIKLMIKEGRTWRNMLGAILGFVLCVAALVPNGIGEFFQRTTIIDVHKWTGTGRFIGMFIEYACGAVVVYFECILIGSIFMGIKAARHIPAFDKDYILILGCQIRKDGTLTKLLQSRADRAIEFSKMQETQTGKQVTFIPSGGQGADEVISEAQAIANYLKETGIPESRILLEDKSKNTYENLRNSVDLISNTSENAPKNIAFSTTNYHVFRAGLLASEQGQKIEGIGSRTKSYFWINAFVREFVATLVCEVKTHLVMFGVLTLIDLAVVLMTYLSNAVLS